MEQKISFKEQEIKRLTEKNNEKDKKITESLVETDRFLTEIEKLNNLYLKQITLKDQKLFEKLKECENIKNFTNLKCIMCIDQIKNSIEYESWHSMVNSLNEQVMNKEKMIKELENCSKEMSCRMSFISKTNFMHLMNSSNYKNIEMKRIKDECDQKMLELEDHFKRQKDKYEEENKLKTTYIEKKVSEINKEVTKLKRELEIKSRLNTKLTKDNSEAQEKIEKLSETLSKSLSDFESQKKFFEEQITDFDFKNKDLLHLKSELEKEIEETKENMLNLKRDNNNIITELKLEIVKYSELYDEAAKENNAFITVNEELERKVKDLQKKLEEIEEKTQAATNNTTSNVKNKKHQNFFELSEIAADHFHFDHSTTKLGSTDNNCLTNINFANLTKLSDLEEVNVKKLEKGNRAIFIPFNEGIYVPIVLNNSDEDQKIFYCNYVLNLNSFDSGIKEVIK